MIILSIQEIYDLACFAGLSIDRSPEMMPDQEELETQITLEDCPANGLLDDDGVSFRKYRHVACFSEYPEEGYIGLGSEVK